MFIIFYIRLALVLIWIALASSAGVVVCILRWGNLNNNHVLGQMISWGALPLLGVKFQLENAEFLRSPQPAIYTVNHQSWLDIPVCGKLCPGKTVIIGKKELKFVPFFGLLFIAAGNLLIDRKNRIRAVAGLAEVTRASKERGASVFVFVEGTRNRTELPMLPFKKGAFHMAIAAQIPIVPIVLPPLRTLVDMKNKRFNGGRLHVKVLAPIPTQGKTSADIEDLLKLTQSRMGEAFATLRSPQESG